MPQTIFLIVHFSGQRETIEIANENSGNLSVLGLHHLWQQLLDVAQNAAQAESSQR
jgi:hypothetical protein